MKFLGCLLNLLRLAFHVGFSSSSIRACFEEAGLGDRRNSDCIKGAQLSASGRWMEALRFLEVPSQDYRSTKIVNKAVADITVGHAITIKGPIGFIMHMTLFETS